MLGLKTKKIQQRLFFGFCFVLSLFRKTNGRENGPDVVKVFVSEGEDVILPCSVNNKENIESKLFDWRKDEQKHVLRYDAGLHDNNGPSGQDEQFKGRVSLFKEQLKFGNASIIIRNTEVNDSGDYICDFPLLQPTQKFYIKLIVGAPPEPFITVLNITEQGVVLQCVVQCAFPEPTLQWRNSDGHILPAEKTQVSKRGGRYDVILQTTVTKTPTNCFTCEVRQEEIGHIVHRNITLPEKLFESCHSAGLFLGGLLAGVLILAVVETVVLLVGRNYITIVWKNGSQQQGTGSSNTAAEPLRSGVEMT
uniref:Ig-like domain-containing protein n=1 Tax=Anabas testudineus TaxID=64144 RepID=A0A7N5ZZI9_ANATE